MIDWSETAPARVIPRPADEAGDYNDDALNDATKALLLKRHALFYTDEGPREIYRDYVSTLINRQNFYSGVLYKNDPTIFAWNLINEPRCETYYDLEDCPQNLQNWIESEAAFIKDLDPNHMLTLGGEGFWASGSPGEAYNPTRWAKSMGQNFTMNHSPDLIDFASIHIWPDTWNIGAGETESWIREHMRDTKENLGKPLLLEEFGKSIEEGAGIDQRNEFYRSIHQIVEDSIREGDVLKGSLFWNWEAEVLPSPGSYAISPEDSTFELIKEHATRVQDLSGKKPTYVCDGIAVPPFAK
jgi:mannan endo-1,4-beta-mannosidase